MMGGGCVVSILGVLIYRPVRCMKVKVGRDLPGLRGLILTEPREDSNKGTQINKSRNVYDNEIQI